MRSASARFRLESPDLFYRGLFTRPAGLIYESFLDFPAPDGHLVPRFALPLQYVATHLRRALDRVLHPARYRGWRGKSGGWM